MRLEEDMIQACVKHMNDCIKRIEQLKSLKVDEVYEEKIKPLILKEVESCISEYLRTLTFLIEKLEESRNISLDTRKELEKATDIKGIQYEILLKLLEKSGLINEKGTLTEKGSQLLGQVVEKKNTASDGAPFATEAFTEVEGLEKFKEAEKDQDGGREEINFMENWGLLESSDDVKEEKIRASEYDLFYEQLKNLMSGNKEFHGIDLSEDRRGKTVNELEKEVRYLIEQRKKPEQIEKDAVTCPNCLSHVEFQEKCPICGYRLVDNK